MSLCVDARTRYGVGENGVVSQLRRVSPTTVATSAPFQRSPRPNVVSQLATRACSPTLSARGAEARRIQIALGHTGVQIAYKEPI